jgi:hypothetical protein
MLIEHNISTRANSLGGLVVDEIAAAVRVKTCEMPDKGRHTEYPRACESGSHCSDRDAGGAGATMSVRDGKTARRHARSTGMYSSTTASAARRKEM